MKKLEIISACLIAMESNGFAHSVCLLSGMNDLVSEIIELVEAK